MNRQPVQTGGPSDRASHSNRQAVEKSTVPRIGYGGMLIGVFLLALFLRIWHLLAIRDTPMMRFPVLDSETYLAWARDIASGNLLGDEPFYQAPLYPYFLAGVIALLGDQPFAVRIVQVFLSAGSCALLAGAVSRLSSRGAGVVAGIMLALYPPSIFFSALIQKTVLDEIGIALLIRLAVGLPPSFRWWSCGLLGFVVGALVQTRENALLFIPVIVLWLLIAHRASATARFKAAAVFVVGASLIPAAVAWRNHAVCGEWLMTTYQGGSNFYIGNNPDANGSYVALSTGRGHTRHERVDAIRIAEAATGKPLSPREVSRFWYDKAWEFIRGRPSDWLRLLLLKSFYLVNRYEIPDSEDPRFYAEHSAILASLGPIWHFGLLAPLAVFGFALLRERDVTWWLLFWLALIFAASTVAFFILARYRYPLVPLLIPFAACGVARLATIDLSAQRRRLGIALAASLPVALPANWPTPFPAQAELATSHANAGIALANAGETDEAERYLKTALRLAPNHASAHFGMGQVWMQRRRPKEAIAALETALAERPNVPYLLTALGTARLMNGQIDAAITALEQSTRADPFDPAAWSNLAEARKRGKEWRAAVEALRRGVQFNPQDADLRIRLAWLLATVPEDDVRDGAAALTLLEPVIETVSDANAVMLDALAAAHAETGRFAQAAAIAEQAIARCGGDFRMAERIRERLDRYRAGRPYRLE